MNKLTIENDLYDERDRAREYLEIAGVMLMALGPVGTITLINRRGAEILGATAGVNSYRGKRRSCDCVKYRGNRQYISVCLPVPGNLVEMLERVE